jgi:tRNA-dihydrouridine synthase
MIGRAAIGNPWIFNQIKHYMRTGKHLSQPTMNERIVTVKKHLQFSLEWKHGLTGIYEMRRHYTNYFKGLENFKPYRKHLVELEDQQALFDLLDEIGDKYQYATDS